MSELVLPETPAKVSLLTYAKIQLTVVAAKRLARRPPQRLKALLAKLSAGTRPASYAEASRARDEVLTHNALCRGRNSCLPRSIATALLCRSRGTWPSWCVGVIASPPFGAHAWVEADGRIVDEPIESTSYRTFFTVEPPMAATQS